MKKNSGQTAIANKIKKWVLTVKELENPIFAIQITRLTSIKSLCKEEIAAEKFALYMAKKVQHQMNEVSCPEYYTDEEWEKFKQLFAEAIGQMESFLETPTAEIKQFMYKLKREIDELQGDNYRRVHWTTIHFVRSGELLKLDYALRCFVEQDFSSWVYKLAREYTEGYEPRYGTGLIPKSAPMLLEIAEFWCQYYFNQSLSEKFPDLGVENLIDKPTG